MSCRASSLAPRLELDPSAANLADPHLDLKCYKESKYEYEVRQFAGNDTPKACSLEPLFPHLSGRDPSAVSPLQRCGAASTWQL